MNDGFVWPRQHAIAILAIETKQARQQYLKDNVDVKFHEWIKIYVRQWWPDRLIILAAIREQEIKKTKKLF